MTQNWNRRGVLKTGAATVAASVAPGIARAQSSKKGGTLRLGLSGANTTDSWDGRSHADTFMITAAHGCVFDCLTEITADGSLVGELAESWEATSDAKIWTFTLRKDVTFHNGKPFGADDVIASFNMHVEEGASSPAQPIIAAIEKTTKLNDHQIQFILTSGNADFPYLLSDYHILIYPAGQIDEAIRDGIGTGLYKVVSFQPGNKLVAERVEGHYKGDDYGHFEFVEMNAINNGTTRMQALMDGDVDAVNRIAFSMEDQLRSNRNIEVFEVTGNQHFTFPMDTSLTPFENMALRQALKFAIDRDEMVEKILGGHGAVANDHPIGPANQFFAADLPQNIYDPERAKSILRDAGLENLRIDLYAADAAFGGAVNASALYQSSAKHAGLNITVIQENDNGYWSNVWLSKPWCACYWAGRATEDWMFTTAYAAEAPWNDTKWVNARFQELLLAGRQEIDTNRRRDIYTEMQSIMSVEGGTVVPMYANFVDAKSTKLAHGPELGNGWMLDGGRIAERWWFA